MSSTLLRTRRARVAEEMKPRARDGNTSRFHPPNPVAGNHPSFRENTKISMEASQKMGMETPPSATSIAPASTHVPRRSAETRPSPRPGSGDGKRGGRKLRRGADPRQKFG